MKRLARFAVFAFGLSVALSASAAGVYKWKDKDGKTHFSDRPPDQHDVQLESAPKRPATPQYRYETGEEEENEAVESKKDAAPAPKTQAERDEEFRKRRAAAAEAKEKADKEAARVAERKENCQRARAQLSALNSGTRVARPTQEGGRTYLDDKGREAEIQRTKKLIEQFCDGK